MTPTQQLVLANSKSEERGYETHCLIYHGALDEDGYGIIKTTGTNVSFAHHAFIKFARRGKFVPEHLCGQHDCVRPTHLTLVPRERAYISRAVLFEREKGLCCVCGKPVNPKEWHREHRISLAHEGLDTPDNMGISHPSCNWAKGST